MSTSSKCSTCQKDVPFVDLWFRDESPNIHNCIECLSDREQAVWELVVKRCFFYMSPRGYRPALRNYRMSNDYFLKLVAASGSGSPIRVSLAASVPLTDRKRQIFEDALQWFHSNVSMEKVVVQ